MFGRFHARARRVISHFPIAFFLLAAIGLSFLSVTAGLSQDQFQPHEEIVADLAAGRVEIAVFKDAIFIGTIENRIEPGTRPPSIVQLGDRRAGILLGAIRWESPAAKIEWARLDRELPQLHSHVTGATANAPHLTGGKAQEEASDIEDIGRGVFERLGAVAENIHGQLNLKEDEPIDELVLADYALDYGPEVWLLRYGVEQQPEKGDFWNTRITGPDYVQLWPPEKGSQHTLMEVRYPADDGSGSLLDLLSRNDPRLQQIPLADRPTDDAFLHGDSRTLLAKDGASFLRSCMNAITPAGARQEIAVIGKDSGLEWVIPPPPEPRIAAPARAANPSNPNTPAARPPGAPSLIKPPPQ